MKRILTILLTVLVSSFAFAEPWDFIRAPAAEVGQLAPIFNWLLLIVTAVLLTISVLALRRTSSKKLKWVTAAFGLFFVKALLVVIDNYISPGVFMNYAIQSFFDLLIVGSLFIAIFRK